MRSFMNSVRFIYKRALRKLQRTKLYELPWNLAMYLLAVIALIIVIMADTYIPVAFMAIIFIMWNVGYVINSTALSGRDPRRIDELVTTAHTYMSWYMLFFGVFFGLLLTGDAEHRRAFIDLCEAANVPLVMLLAPLVLMSISIKFIPIKIGENIHSPALRALFVVTISCQQIAIFLLLNNLMRLTISSARM